MSQGQAHATKSQEKPEQARSLVLEPIRRPEQGLAQPVAPLAVYRRAQFNPHAATPANFLALQRTVGNRRVQQMVEQRKSHRAQGDDGRRLLKADGEQGADRITRAAALSAPVTQDGILRHRPNKDRLARDASPAAQMQQAREQTVRGAMDFLDTLRRLLAADRLRARLAAAQAAGIAEGSRRAHPILNQAGVRERLRRGRGIYDAQRGSLDANHPLQGELRQAYARFLSEAREAFDEALSLAQHDQQAQLREQSAYGESLVRWMEASPLRNEALVGRTRLTAADVAASQLQESDLATVLSTLVPHLNLVQPGMTARARAAINATRNRVTAQTTGAAQRTTATGATQTAADAAIAMLDGAERTIDRGRTMLRAAIARLDVWLQAPTQPIDVADRVNELFNTRDPGYGQLLRDRLQVMLNNLAGSGSLFAHMHRPADASTCTTPSTLGEMTRPYEFHFCGSFRSLDHDAGVLLHELAHAVIPGRGSRGPAGAGHPLDRAYAGERLLRRMSTEEALNNAESYFQLIAGLAGTPVATIPTDTVTGCTDTGPLLDALALAQSAHRRAWSHLEEVQDQLRNGRPMNTMLQAQINTHWASPSPPDLLVMLQDFYNLQVDASAWHTGHTFLCPPARSCPAGALAFDNRRVYRSGAASARRRSGSSDPRICPAFFALSADDRARAAHVLVSLSFAGANLQRPQMAWGYAALALAIYRNDFGAPPASNLAEHQAADRGVSPQTP